MTSRAESIGRQHDGGKASPWSTSTGLRYLGIGVLVAAFLVVLAGFQAAAFYARFAPRIADANAVYFDLLVEKTEGRLYRRIEVQLQGLTAAEHDTGDSVDEAWNRFDDAFLSSPRDAVEALRAQLPLLAGEFDDPGVRLERLAGDLDRLQRIYTDPYKMLGEQLARPPFYLWPTAAWLAEGSEYRQAVTLNRALYLAQLGEIGTARVLLTGVHASTDDPQLLGLVNYTLGRLQFELLRSRPEAEFYTQSVQYLRRSLEADPDAPLARRFFDYLLSLSQATAAPRAGEGAPTAPSEGEGAAISPDKRKF